MAIALFGFWLRWLHVSVMAETPLYRWPHGDGKVYLKLADALREGGWTGLLREGSVDYQAPLYPHLLALFQALFGDALSTLRQGQAALGGASVFLMGLGTSRLVGARAGLCAAGLLAVFGPSIWLDGLVQKSALTGFLVSSVIALWSFVGRSESARSSAAMGAAIGLLMLTRGEARLWALGMGAAVWWLGSKDRSSRERVRQLAGYGAGLALAITPVFLRNGVCGGDWVLTTSQAGTNLFIGNRAGADGSYAPLVVGRGDARYEADDARRLAEGAEGRGLTPTEVSRHWRRRAFDDMA
ncbi:MAG: glycosyltransferase family 39 protein, partial [Planctomycetota bacterium]